MADDQKDPKDPKDPVDPKDPKDPKDPSGDDKSSNLQKALDAEREEKKNLQKKLKEIEDSKEADKKKADQKKLEEEGKYKEALESKDKEISELKPKADRLEKLLESVGEKNKTAIDSIEDEEQKKFAQKAIEGKDAIDASEILGSFQSLLGGKKPEKKGGNGVPNDKKEQDGADDVEITKLKEELDAIFKKKREGQSLSNLELKAVVELPKKIKELRDKKGKED